MVGCVWLWLVAVGCGWMLLVEIGCGGFFDRRLVVVSFLLNMVGTGII